MLVLNDINLEVQDGELVCILGPSGCGKTTLCRIIAGFDQPTSGVLLVDGRDVTGPTPDSIFVFQHSGLLPWMTVWDNVKLGVRKMSDRDEMAERIQEYVDIVDLQGFEHHYPGQLSGPILNQKEKR